MTPREIAERFPPDSKVEINGKTDHMTVTVPQYSRDQLAAIWNTAVLAEREACAQIADDKKAELWPTVDGGMGTRAAEDIAAEIRARQP